MRAAAIYPALIAFVIELVLCPVLIPVLTRLKCGQYIREEGPQAHQKKAGTPTMGGIIIVAAILVGSLFFVQAYPKMVPVLLVTVGFGLVGLIDDFLKVVLKHNEGLKPLPKFTLQILISALFAYYLYRAGYSTAIVFHLFGGLTIELGWFFYVFVVLAMTAFVNGVNFTDGLDGLAASVTAIIAAFFAVVSWGQTSDVLPAASAAVGSLLGFLLFNTNPAKVFMGDTGSLALGGFVTATAFMLDMPMILLLVGLIYVAEVLSVILQVAYFKATKGKRLFRMAPIHHHFELGGWKETKVVAVFSIITAMLCLVGFLLV
jgi:phospho-N-acetylmuramoyl-pentapeptide-transferase